MVSIKKLKVGEILFLIDFVKNYSFKEQNEVQTHHWYNFQMTILVHITYKMNLDHNQDDPRSCRLIIEYHYYCSHDKKHYNLFVQKCFSLH
jgi:hypothetical protein